MLARIAATATSTREASTRVCRWWGGALGSGATARAAARTIVGKASASTTASATAQPQLVEIPRLPLVGSMLPFHSGFKIDPNDANGTFRKLGEKYGTFYSLGMPGIGKGWEGTLYVTGDPGEMMKVLRQEGAYPSGGGENQWVLWEWYRRRNFRTKAMYERGPEWKRIRSFMQKDMLAPQSAREYIPGMLKAGAKASPKAAEWADKDDILRFLNFCAVDMFNSVHFGAHNEMSKDDYETFCDAAVRSFHMGIKINRDPLVRIACKMGWRTPSMKRYMELMDTVHDITSRRQAQVLDKIQSGWLTDEDKESYFYKSLQRLDESDITLDELLEIGLIIMQASVDTTSTKTAWNVVQLAVNPDKQEVLRDEIHRTVVQEGGRLTSAALDTPYLKAFIRETHRCTPIGPLTLIKELASSTEIHGVELPAGSLVGFDSLFPQFNPDLVEDPMSFLPERWLPDAVEARKGTPAAVIDHPFFSGPFSQGARRCPGSRVAYLEVQVLLAQLLLDWRIDCPVELHWSEVKSTVESAVVPVFPRGVRFIPRS